MGYAVESGPGRTMMEQLKYKGNDPRLEYGAVYNCTVNRKPRAGVYLSVHTSLKNRVYKQYSNPRLFEKEWSRE